MTPDVCMCDLSTGVVPSLPQTSDPTAQFLYCYITEVKVCCCTDTRTHSCRNDTRPTPTPTPVCTG